MCLASSPLSPRFKIFDQCASCPSASPSLYLPVYSWRMFTIKSPNRRMTHSFSGLQVLLSERLSRSAKPCTRVFGICFKQLSGRSFWYSWWKRALLALRFSWVSWRECKQQWWEVKIMWQACGNRYMQEEAAAGVMPWTRAISQRESGEQPRRRWISYAPVSHCASCTMVCRECVSVHRFE